MSLFLCGVFIVEGKGKSEGCENSEERDGPYCFYSVQVTCCVLNRLVGFNLTLFVAPRWMYEKKRLSDLRWRRSYIWDAGS